MDLGTPIMFTLIAWAFLVPILAIIALRRAWTAPRHRRGWLSLGLVLAIVWIPMLSNFLGVWNTIWPLPTGSIRSAVDLPEYRVEFVSNSIHFEVSEYFDIIRNDGKRGYVNIDGDANPCKDFHTRREGARVFFVCNNHTISSFVDTEQALVYADWQSKTTRLADVEFKDPD